MPFEDGNVYTDMLASITMNLCVYQYFIDSFPGFLTFFDCMKKMGARLGVLYGIMLLSMHFTKR